MNNDEFYVNLKEAFEWGRLMGQKEAYYEMADTAFEDAQILQKYIQMKLHMLELAINIVQAGKGTSSGTEK
jgi:hypothetical protein